MIPGPQRELIVAELHADLFSRHASPLKVCIFLTVDECCEDVMSDEFCRRCHGKQQRKRRGGRSVQLADWFMILHSSSRRFVRVRTYYARPNIFGEKKNKRRSGLGMDM